MNKPYQRFLSSCACLFCHQHAIVVIPWLWKAKGLSAAIANQLVTLLEALIVSEPVVRAQLKPKPKTVADTPAQPRSIGLDSLDEATLDSLATHTYTAPAPAPVPPPFVANAEHLAMVSLPSRVFCCTAAQWYAIAATFCCTSIPSRYAHRAPQNWVWCTPAEVLNGKPRQGIMLNYHGVSCAHWPYFSFVVLCVFCLSFRPWVSQKLHADVLFRNATIV